MSSGLPTNAMSLNFRITVKTGSGVPIATVKNVTQAQRKSGWKQLGWRVCLAAGLIAAGYGAWLLIPMVVRSDFAPHIKTPLIAMLGATPLLTKLAAIALFGKPVVDLVKRYVVHFWQR